MEMSREQGGCFKWLFWVPSEFCVYFTTSLQISNVEFFFILAIHICSYTLASFALVKRSLYPTVVRHSLKAEFRWIANLVLPAEFFLSAGITDGGNGKDARLLSKSWSCGPSSKSKSDVVHGGKRQRKSQLPTKREKGEESKEGEQGKRRREEEREDRELLAAIELRPQCG